jgi:SP family general alpha glucoside:H+ symporter-like MFS transporter
MAKQEEPNAKECRRYVIHTNNIEKEITEGHSYLNCFRVADLRRTEVACIVFAGQVSADPSFAYCATYFFEQAGLNPDDAYKLGLGGKALAFVGTIISYEVHGSAHHLPVWHGRHGYVPVHNRLPDPR